MSPSRASLMRLWHAHRTDDADGPAKRRFRVGEDGEVAGIPVNASYEAPQG